MSCVSCGLGCRPLCCVPVCRWPLPCFFPFVPSGCCFFFCLFSSCLVFAGLVFCLGLSSACCWVVFARLWLVCLWVLFCRLVLLRGFVVSVFPARPCQVPTSRWSSSRRGCLAWSGGGWVWSGWVLRVSCLVWSCLLAGLSCAWLWAVSSSVLGLLSCVSSGRRPLCFSSLAGGLFFVAAASV